MTVSDFFFCYDRSLMLKLKAKGFKFLFVAKHEVTDKKFFLFEKTEELEKALSEIA